MDHGNGSMKAGYEKIKRALHLGMSAPKNNSHLRLAQKASESTHGEGKEHSVQYIIPLQEVTQFYPSPTTWWFWKGKPKTLGSEIRVLLYCIVSAHFLLCFNGYFQGEEKWTALPLSLKQWHENWSLKKLLCKWAQAFPWTQFWRNSEFGLL